MIATQEAEEPDAKPVPISQAVSAAEPLSTAESFAITERVSISEPTARIGAHRNYGYP